MRCAAAVLGLATGGTPVGMYRLLIDDHQKNHTSYRNVKTFNLDEYVGMFGDNPQSYRFFMNDKLFNHIDIQKTNTHVPKGDAADMIKECTAYETLIKEHGGVDLQVLGIGSNGHIGFDEREPHSIPKRKSSSLLHQHEKRTPDSLLARERSPSARLSPWESQPS